MIGIRPAVPYGTGNFRLAVTMTPRILFLRLAICLAGLETHAALVAPDVQEPAPDAAVVGPYPHFAWQPVAEAEAYRVQVARDSAFADLVHDGALHAVVQWFVQAQPLPLGDYRWRVRAETESGTAGPWSESRVLHVVAAAAQFTITNGAPLAEVRDIARQAAARPSSRIRFEKGIHRWDPGYQGTVFSWSGASNIVVEGNGSEIHLLDPSAQTFQLRNCRGIVIRGLTLHHDPMPYSALAIEAVEPKGAWMDARVLAGFAEERYPREVNQFFLYAVAPGDFMQKHPDRPGHTYLAWDRTTRLGENRFRFFPRSSVEQGSLRQLKPGDEALVCYRRWPLNYMTSCRDIVWAEMTAGHSEGALFMGGDNADIKFLGLVCRRHSQYFPTAGGWVTGNDRRGPWIENCIWEGMTDDGPNITGNSFLIDAASNGNQFVVSTGPGYQTTTWAVGDDVVFWNPTNGLPLAETRVLEASRAGNRITVRVADAIPDVVPGRDLHRNTHVYNLSTQNRQLVIRGNTLIGGRRFGFNVKTIDALIERNRFEGQASSAIYLENEPSGWEGLVNRHVVVQDNTIVGCGRDLYSQRVQRAGIHVNLWRNEPVMAETPWIGHRDVVIRRNTIRDAHGIAIGVDNAERVSISGNTIALAPGNTNTAIRVFERTRDVVVRDSAAK